MAKKTRKQKQRATARRPAGPAAAVTDADASGATAQAVADPVAGDDLPGAAAERTEAAATGRRRVERVTPTAAAPARPAQRTRSRFQGSSAALVAPLDSDDPAIPFDRVPYVPADLRRVSVIALLMLALIIVVAIVVNNVVK